jgi:hypothetical protein
MHHRIPLAAPSPLAPYIMSHARCLPSSCLFVEASGVRYCTDTAYASCFAYHDPHVR